MNPRPRHRGLLIALALYSLALAVALLAPTSKVQYEMAGWVRDLGRAAGIRPGLSNQDRAEFLCNALILAPVSALGSLVWRRTAWRDWTAYAFVIASGVELAQGLFLPHRTASATDVVANTLGGLLGAVTVAVVRRVGRVVRRPAPSPAPAPADGPGTP